MLQQTKAIVLNSIKYGDNSLICTCYTEKSGIRTYMLKGILKRKKGTLKKAFFQPLTQLQLIANHNDKGHLNSLKEAEISYRYENLQTDIVKQSISLFISEVLYSSLREEETNKPLFQFLETSLIWLDTHSNITNFHLLFLLHLTKHLGFYPENNSSMPYFDLVEGKFMIEPSSKHYIKEPKITYLKTLLGIKFDALSNVSFNNSQRKETVELLIEYIGLHLQSFKKPKSIAILHAIFK